MWSGCSRATSSRSRTSRTQILNGTLTSEVFTPSNGFIRVPPRGTALVAVLPSAFGPSPLDPTPITTPTFEVRGYVRLKLPSLFQAGGPGSFFRRVPQAQAPVRVLLTPQFRSTFFAANGAITDQIQATVPTASGKGENLVPPEPGGRIVLTPPVFTGIPILPDRIRASIGIESQMMASMLAELDPESDLRGFNAALEKAGVPYAIERRKGQVTGPARYRRGHALRRARGGCPPAPLPARGVHSRG
jgi:hypothetical protein